MSDYDFWDRQKEIDRIQDYDPNKASSMQWQLDNDRIDAAGRRQQDLARMEADKAGTSSLGMGVPFPGANVSFPRRNSSPDAGNILRELLHWKSLLIWAGVIAIIHYTNWGSGFTSGVAPGKAYFLVAAAAFVTSRTLRQYMVGCGLLCIGGFIALTLCGLWLASHTTSRPAAHRLGTHIKKQMLRNPVLPKSKHMYHHRVSLGLVQFKFRSG